MMSFMITFSSLYFNPSLYFLQQYYLHRYLHSFPTRRSSDLTSQNCFNPKYDLPWTKGFNDVIICTYLKPLNTIRLLTRSEEHTSELQSRGHIVCRLLVEKKQYLNNLILQSLM